MQRKIRKPENSKGLSHVVDTNSWSSLSMVFMKKGTQEIRNYFLDSPVYNSWQKAGTQATLRPN